MLLEYREQPLTEHTTEHTTAYEENESSTAFYLVENTRKTVEESIRAIS
jgi:hypothetical protein